MDAPSISPITRGARIPGDRNPRSVHVGDVIEAFGEEGTVRRITTEPAWPLEPRVWTLDAFTPDGTELVVARDVEETVHVVRAACPNWVCPMPGCRAHARSTSWFAADAERLEHVSVWHGVAA